ncbi:MAG: hypothetical protein M2R45_04178 [Verrucomicrobia subdivision 3 bacterium]|nr:hypothetical protein [Limisphaerales bacterium]MCS1413017.1 hypothetical protein [Limisphaerales bacterium]
MANEVLYAFYDPPSRRMKAAVIPFSSDKNAFYHRGRVYRSDDRYLETGTIYSKDEKVIGFGFEDEIEHCFCPAINARNAVVDGHRNDVYLYPGNTFATLYRRKYRCASIYWYLTETWEEFEERVSYLPEDKCGFKTSLAWPIDYFPLGGAGFYIWEGVSDEGLRNDDCIMEIDNYSDKDPGFELATENIPQYINARTFRPPPPETS